MKHFEESKLEIIRKISSAASKRVMEIIMLSAGSAAMVAGRQEGGGGGGTTAVFVAGEVMGRYHFVHVFQKEKAA